MPTSYVHTSPTHTHTSRVPSSRDRSHTREIKHHLVTRNADLQLLHDSSTETTGKKVVELVPPAVGGWKPAPPHVASHWGTISQHYQDPPPVRRRW